jgi:MFS superfamily sulfate permease-like transporter
MAIETNGITNQVWPNIKNKSVNLKQFFPIFEWGKTYDKGQFTNDGIAAIIVTIMLIPQSLAYALLAGLPAEMGIYASIIPIILYAIFGTSRALARDWGMSMMVTMMAAIPSLVN